MLTKLFIERKGHEHTCEHIYITFMQLAWKHCVGLWKKTASICGWHSWVAKKLSCVNIPLNLFQDIGKKEVSSEMKLHWKQLEFWLDSPVFTSFHILKALELIWVAVKALISACYEVGTLFIQSGEQQLKDLMTSQAQNWKFIGKASYFIILLYIPLWY